MKSKKISKFDEILQAIMKSEHLTNNDEGIKNAKLFLKAVTNKWNHEVTYCYHDLINMINMKIPYDLFDSDNGWGIRLEPKNQSEEAIQSLLEIFLQNKSSSNEQ